MDKIVPIDKMDNSFLLRENAECQKRLKWYEKRYGPYIEKKGLQNWKNLFRWPTLQEGLIFIMIVFVLFLAWSYKAETQQCRDFLENFETEACVLCEQQKAPIIEPFSSKEDDLIELNLTES